MEAAATLRQIFVTGALVALVSLSSCSSAKKQPNGPDTGTGASTAGESFGPPEPATGPTFGPEPIVFRPAVVVLGPGMARGFAHVGVLRAMKEAKIPVGALLGCEIGSLIASLYAVDGNLNHLEWALQKFKEDTLTGKGDLLPSLFKKMGSGGKLQYELKKAFGLKDIVDTKIPLRVLVQPKGSENPMILEKGEIAQALRAALADPELIEPGLWNGAEAHAARSVEPFLVKEARALGLGPVIWIDASEGAQQAGEGPHPDVDLVIRPDLEGISSKDFGKRTTAVFRGKNAVKSQLKQLRTLVGLPPEPGKAMEVSQP